jgi:hypothetical protein
MNIEAVANIASSHRITTEMPSNSKLQLGPVCLPHQPSWISSLEELLVGSGEVLELELVLSTG